jgi:hypothetical protein
MAQIDDTTYDAKVYAKMLQGKDDSDDDDDDENSDSDDGYDAEPMTPSEFQQSMIRKTSTENQNPLIHQFDINESQSMKTARWFSNPLFAAIGQSVSTTTNAKRATTKTNPNASAKIDSDVDDDDDDQVEVAKKERLLNRDNDNGKKRKANSRETDETIDGTANDKLSAEDIIASMPKTDKQIRHEKRLKLMERDERKKLKRAQKSGDTENEFQLVANTSKNGNNSDSENEDDPNSRASKQSLDHF